MTVKYNRQKKNLKERENSWTGERGETSRKASLLHLFNKTPIHLLIAGLKNRIMGSLIGQMPYSSNVHLV